MKLSKFLQIFTILLICLAIPSQGADKKVSELNSLGQSSWATGDLFQIVDVSATESKKTTVGDFDARFLKLTGSSSFAGSLSPSTDNIYDLGIDATNRWRNLYVAGAVKLGTVDITGALNSAAFKSDGVYFSSSGARFLTLNLAGSEVQNSTDLTVRPVSTSGGVKTLFWPNPDDSGVASDHIVARATTDTLTNKTMAVASNNIDSTANTVAVYNSSGHLSTAAQVTLTQTASPQITRDLFVDGCRSDSYSPDGSRSKPYKGVHPITDAKNKIISNADNGGVFPNIVSYIIHVAPCLYTEHLVLEDADLQWVTIDGGDAQSTLLAVTSGNAIQSTSNNANLIYLAIKNMWISGPVVFHGEAGGTQGDSDFIFDHVVIQGSKFEIKNWETLELDNASISSSAVTFENLWFATFANGTSISADIAATFDAAHDLGANIDSTNIRFQDGLFTGNITAGDSVTLIMRNAPRMGATSTTMALGSGATLDAYSGNIRGNVTVDAAATFNNHGAVVDPALVTGTMTAAEGYGKFSRLVDSGLSTGVVHSSSVGALTSSAVNLASADVTGVAGPGSGGTGVASLTANNVILGNGTSPVNFVAPSTSGNVLTSNGTTWTSAVPSGGSGGAGLNQVILQAGNGHGSTNTKIRRFSTVISNVGAAIAYVDSSTNGATFTIQEKGLYSINYYDNYTIGVESMGISLNSTQLTTGVDSLTNASEVMVLTTIPAAGFPMSCSTSRYLQVGDVVRAHDNGTSNGTDGKNSGFSIVKMNIAP